MSEHHPKYFRTIAEWRNWLSENHTDKETIWVIIQKKASKKQGIRYGDAVLEAVAHGWIDGKMKRLNRDEFMQRYTPRGKNSVWSLSNRRRAERLISEGRMTAAGFEAVEEAKRNGRWANAYSSGSGAVDVPRDLMDALKENEDAREKFESFPPSARFMYVHWINEAKRDDTRERRIHTVVERSKKNLRPGPGLRIIEKKDSNP